MLCSKYAVYRFVRKQHKHKNLLSETGETRRRRPSRAGARISPPYFSGNVRRYLPRPPGSGLDPTLLCGATWSGIPVSAKNPIPALICFHEFTLLLVSQVLSA